MNAVTLLVKNLVKKAWNNSLQSSESFRYSTCYANKVTGFSRLSYVETKEKVFQTEKEDKVKN